MILTFGLGYRDVDIKSRTRKYISSGITPVVDTHGIRKDGHEVEDILSIAEVAIGVSLIATTRIAGFYFSVISE